MKQGAIGIDFGSLQSIVAVATKGGVDVMLDEASSRETPNYVSYTQKERLIGQLGKLKERQNFKNTIKYLNRFIDIKGDSPYLRNEKKWLSCKTSVNDENKLYFDITSGGENYQLLPEQVIATMLSKLKSIIEKAGFNGKDIVLSVPSYFTEQQRKLILQAGRIAEINIVRLFNESSAVALSWGIFRKRDLTEENQNILFFDFGQSKLSAFVGQFNKKGMKILCQAHNEHCGVRDIDWELLNYYCSKVEQKEGINPNENKKSIIRLLDSIAKQRQMLSANKEVPINVECLIEDIDFSDTLKREDFEKLIEPVTQNIQKCIENIQEQIKTKKISINEIEILGGGSRIPIFQEMIEKAFKKQLCKTLHATECISKGCAMMAAMISPLFHVTDYEIEEINYNNIKCQWEFVDNDQSNTAMEIENTKNTALLFAANCSIPNIKSLTFNKNQLTKKAIAFKLFYDPVPVGAQQILSTYYIKKPKIKEDVFNIKLRAKLDHNGIVSLSSAELNEDFVEEVKIPIKKEQKKEEPKKDETKKEEKKPDSKEASPKPTENNGQEQQEENKPQEQQQAQPQENENKSSKIEEEKQESPKGEKMQEEVEYKIETKKKTRTTEIKYQKYDAYFLNEQSFQKLYTIESTQKNKDKLIKETYQKKNEFESYIYYMKDKIQNAYSDYTTADIKTKFLADLNKAEEWLYEEGQHASKGTYIQQIDSLKLVGEKVEARFNQFKFLYQGVEALNNSILYWKSLVATQDELYAHITAEERQPILDEAAAIEKYKDEIIKRVQATPKHQDPVDQPNDIIKKNTEFCQKSKDIMSKPKPEPKKEEPKPEEKKEDTKIDEEKKDNEQQEQPAQQQAEDQKQETSQNNQTNKDSKMDIEEEPKQQ